MDYTAERHAFPGYKSQKVKTFCRLYGRKACNCEIFCVKAGFSTVKSVESLTFSRTILLKGMPFRRIIRRKSKLPANYPAESFSILRKVKISPYKGLSLLLQIILDKKSTMGDQYYPRFGRIIKKHGKTENNNLTFRR
jgi:hypothetical protein